MSEETQPVKTGRDDSILVSGRNSQTATIASRVAKEVAAKKGLKADEKKRKQVKLSPSGKIISDLIRTELIDLRKNNIDLSKTPDEIKIELVARKKAEDIIVKFAGKLANTLRENV